MVNPKPILPPSFHRMVAFTEGVKPITMSEEEHARAFPIMAAYAALANEA